ncbi:MAG: DinB family protein [Bacteroidota bacterium]
MTPTPGLPHADRLGAELAALLRGRNAHLDAEAILAGIPVDRVNDRPPGAPHSLWELLEHLRFTQADILEFCQPAAPASGAPEAGYAEKRWPDDYWPRREGTAADWTVALGAFLRDRDALVALALDPEADLLDEFDHAPGYTLARELMLAADHNSHHLGQVILLRRQLGLWPPG